MMRLPLAVTV